MKIEITVKNYRSYSDAFPMKFILQTGFTAIIGTNNSGKSNVLKFFYDFRNLFANLGSQNGVAGALKSLKDKSSNAFNVQAGTDLSGMFYDGNSRDVTIIINPFEIEYDFLHEKTLQIKTIEITVKRTSTNYEVKVFHEHGERDINKTGAELALKEIPKRIFGLLSGSVFIGPYRNILNSTMDQQYYDIEIGKRLISRWKSWKSGGIKEQREQALSMILVLKEIFGNQELEIDASDDMQSLIVNMSGKSYNINDLGSGLSQFIIVLMHVVVNRPSLVLIDEPELNLHPLLQKKFIEALGRFSKFGVLFCTHSLGLARSISDTIYYVQKNNENQSQIKDYGHKFNLCEVLGELNYSGMHEIGFNKVLLVEGTTEVKVFNHLLRLYKKDMEVLAIPLGGSSMINQHTDHELAEFKRISENAYIIIDSERENKDSDLSEERKSFIKNATKLKFKCHVTEFRAIENYFSDAAIKKSLGDKYKKLTPYESQKNGGWNKNINWKIVSNMSKDDFDKTDVGKFIEKI